jgi:uncharacterized double-CXXCG motif protein
MLLFRIQPDDANWGKHYRYYINAAHRWKLPGVRCPSCGRWATVGLDYPAVDLSSLPSEPRYRHARSVELEEYEELKQHVLTLLPGDAVVAPGTEFGPLVGKAWGTFGAFAWLNPWTVLMGDETLRHLESEGVQGLQPVIPELTYRRKAPIAIQELQIEPIASLASSALPLWWKPSCKVCGRHPNPVNRIVVDRASVPKDKDLFRIREFTTVILATERFRDVAQSLNMSDILFDEITVAD